jgi:uncharacterized membrane protein YphA (DoxX/SURF4 family)
VNFDVTLLSGAIVGAVFVYAGVSKVLSGRRWPQAARQLGVPPAVAYTVMVAEVVVGLGVVLGGMWQQGFLAAAAVMLLAFTLLLAVRMRDAERPPCACFGATKQRPIGSRDIVRNVSLLVLVMVAFVS